MGRHLSRIGPQLINVLKGNVALSGDLLALGKKLYPLFFGVAGLSPDDPFPIQLVFDQNRDRNIFPAIHPTVPGSCGVPRFAFPTRSGALAIRAQVAGSLAHS